jgi:hypothetical protein
MRDNLVAAQLINGKDWVAPSRARMRASLFEASGQSDILHNEEERLAWLREQRRASQVA